MTDKQEEIREDMEFIAEKGFGLDWNSSVYLIDTILEYQHSQGLKLPNGESLIKEE